MSVFTSCWSVPSIFLNGRIVFGSLAPLPPCSDFTTDALIIAVGDLLLLLLLMPLLMHLAEYAWLLRECVDRLSSSRGGVGGAMGRCDDLPV